MRIADIDFILIPEWLAARPGSGSDGAKPDDDHWISRWHRNIATACWLESTDQTPASALLNQCDAASRPIIIVTHGHAVDIVLENKAELSTKPVIGAFIVAPTSISGTITSLTGSELPLNFSSVIVAPDNHPDVTPKQASELARALGGHFVAAGETGRLDSGSGQGPWPEGLMRLGWFLKQLSTH